MDLETKLKNAETALADAMAELIKNRQDYFAEKIWKAWKETIEVLKHPSFTSEIEILVKTEIAFLPDQLLEAVKALRARKGISLKEAKDIVCAYRDKHFQAPARS